MFCSNCGKQLIDGAYSCPYCGEVVPTREKKSEESAPMVEKEVKAEESVAAAADEAKKEWTPDAQPAYIPTEEPVAQPEKAKKMPTITLVGFIASLASILWSIFAIPGLIISLIALKGYKKDPTLPGKKFALAGLIIGIAILALSILLLAFGLVASLFAMIIRRSRIFRRRAF